MNSVRSGVSRLVQPPEPEPIACPQHLSNVTAPKTSNSKSFPSQFVFCCADDYGLSSARIQSNIRRAPLGPILGQ
jgi:hypothetical protein